MANQSSILEGVSTFFGTRPVFVVGGAVRDRLLGGTVEDVDLVIEDHPQKSAEKLAKLTGGHAFVLDAERGVSRISYDSGFQIDISKIQGDDFQADLDRRDFSINALSVALADWLTPRWKKRINDRHNGLADLERKNVRAISPQVFKDDPLRLLRAFRIACDLQFSIDKSTLALAKRQKALIRKPAPERIREELLKLFCNTTTYPYVVAMEKTGLLDYLLPETQAMRRTGIAYYGRGGVLKHTLDSLKMLEDIFGTLNGWFPKCGTEIKNYLAQPLGGYPRSAHLKWAVLLHDIGKPKTAKIIDGRLRFFEHEHVGARKVEAVARQFRWSTDETQRFSRLVRNHMRPGNLATHENVGEKAIHRFFRDLGDDAIGMLLVSLGDHLSYLTPRQLKARSTSHEKITQRMVKTFYLSKEKVLPAKILTGFDVMKGLNLKPSPLIGQLLEAVTDAQSEGKVKSKDDAIAYLKKRLPEFQKTNP